jgi:hypothetical protein
MSKIFPVLLALLVNKIIGGGDFSQRSEEDRNSADMVSRGELVDILPRHKLVSNFKFIKDFEDLFKLGCLLCHLLRSLFLGQMVIIFWSCCILVSQGRNLDMAISSDSNHNKIEISDWFASFACIRMKDDSSHGLKEAI